MIDADDRRSRVVKKALIPGTFDPITKGHLEIIERSTQIFDEIIVGVAASQSKGGGPLFSHEERVELARAATEHLENVSIMPFNTLLVDFAHEIGVLAIVKGLRAVTDFESEFQMAALNYHLSPDLETVFIMATPEYMYLSSSVVREIAQFGGDISDLVPPVVARALAAKLR